MARSGGPRYGDMENLLNNQRWFEIIRRELAKIALCISMDVRQDGFSADTEAGTKGQERAYPLYIQSIWLFDGGRDLD